VRYLLPLLFTSRPWRLSSSCACTPGTQRAQRQAMSRCTVQSWPAHYCSHWLCGGCNLNDSGLPSTWNQHLPAPHRGLFLAGIRSLTGRKDGVRSGVEADRQSRCACHAASQHSSAHTLYSNSVQGYSGVQAARRHACYYMQSVIAAEQLGAACAGVPFLGTAYSCCTAGESEHICEGLQSNQPPDMPRLSTTGTWYFNPEGINWRNAVADWKGQERLRLRCTL
jgi:hypothetical protein